MWYLWEWLESVDQSLGSISDQENPFSYKQAVLRFEADRYPNVAVDKLNALHLSRFSVPDGNSYSLINLERLWALIRLLARRDLTIALSYGASYFSALPIWIGGSHSQKKAMRTALISGGRGAYCISERRYGTDVQRNEFRADVDDLGENVLLNGSKWPINGVHYADYFVFHGGVFDASGELGRSIIIANKEDFSEGNCVLSEVELTRGVRGIDLAGVELKDVVVPISRCVGEPGQGDEILLKSLQVSRTLCSGLSIGVADAALREAVFFLTTRKLYARQVGEIPYCQSVIADCVRDYAFAECLSISVVRLICWEPQCAMLMSALAKYVIPVSMQALVRNASDLIGARTFLRNPDIGLGVFYKLIDDIDLVPIFDGNTQSNLGVIAQCLVKEAFNHHDVTEGEAQSLEDSLISLLNLRNPCQELDFTSLHLSTNKLGSLIHLLNIFGVQASFEVLSLDKISSRDLIKNIARYFVKIRSDYISLRKECGSRWAKSMEQFNAAKHLGRIVSTACVYYFWVSNRANHEHIFSSDILIKSLLAKMLPEVFTLSAKIGRGDDMELFKFASRSFNDESVFSLLKDIP